MFLCVCKDMANIPMLAFVYFLKILKKNISCFEPQLCYSAGTVSEEDAVVLEVERR